MSDLKILTAVSATIILIAVASVLILFIPYDSTNAVDRSSIIRNYVLTAAAPIGAILAIWRLYSIERTLNNDTEKLYIERRMSAIRLLNSSDKPTQDLAVDLIDKLQKIDTESTEILNKGLYRFFQESHRKEIREARVAFKEEYAEDLEKAYLKWLNRETPTIAPSNFLNDFSVLIEDRRHYGLLNLSMRGRRVTVNKSTQFTDCDFSDCEIIINGGCDFVACDLTRANVILIDVEETASLGLSHCNISHVKIEPSLPSDFEKPEVRRTGWFFEGQPPRFGEYMGMPNFNAKIPFSFEDGGSRSVSKEKIPEIILGELSYSSARGFPFLMEGDDHNIQARNQNLVCDK